MGVGEGPAPVPAKFTGVEVRESLVFPTCGFSGLNSSPYSWWYVLLSTETFHQPYLWESHLAEVGPNLRT